MSELTCCVTSRFVHHSKVGKLDATGVPAGSDPFVLVRASLADKIELELKGRDLATFRQAPVEKAVYAERGNPDVQVDKLPLTEINPMKIQQHIT